MMMRRGFVRTSIVLAALSLFTSFFPRSAMAAGYSVVVDGQVVSTAQAEMQNGQLMVAIRPLVNAMGGSVDWLQVSQRATVHYQGTNLAVWYGSNLAYQDGSPTWVSVAPYYKNGMTMVPGWWLASRLGTKVQFDGTRLLVNTGRAPAPAPVSSDPLKDWRFFFPFPAGSTYQPYYDGYGDPRSFQGSSFSHEGIDLLAPKGTPIVAVASGTVVRYGWNTLGGYRLTIQLDQYPGYRFYYAHMDRYAPGIYQGAHVNAGQLLGYVGSTGEGPERTEGHFVTHLHFGIYSADGTTLDPYPYLRFWEAHKASVY